MHTVYVFKNTGSSIKKQSSGAKNSNLKLINYNLIYHVHEEFKVMYVKLKLAPFERVVMLKKHTIYLCTTVFPHLVSIP